LLFDLEKKSNLPREVPAEAEKNKLKKKQPTDCGVLARNEDGVKTQATRDSTVKIKTKRVDGRGGAPAKMLLPLR